MPRAVSDTSEAPKRAPRRRVARPRAKKTVATPAVEKTIEREPDSLPSRKAPTRIASPTRANQSLLKAKVYVPITIGLISCVAAVTIGYSDKGQIDLASLEAKYNADLATGVVTPGADSDVGAPTTIPVQRRVDTRPNGGLRPSDGSVPAAVPEPESTSSSTATSTATSTDPVTTEDTDIYTEDAQTESNNSEEAETTELEAPEEELVEGEVGA